MKYIYLTIGFLSLGLGVLGIFLPILPTTPFLLLTSYCFAKGSDRFHRWFVNTSLYKKHLEDYVQNRAMTLKTKWSILLSASFMLLIPLLLLNNLYMRIAILLLYICKYYYFFFRIKTIPQPTGREEDSVS